MGKLLDNPKEFLNSLTDEQFKKILDDYDIEYEEVDKIISKIKYKDKGTIIYPYDIMLKYNTGYDVIYRMLDNMVQTGILEHRFILYCHKCDEEYDYKILKSLNEIPKGLCCKNGHNINILKDTIIVYKRV